MRQTQAYNNPASSQTTRESILEILAEVLDPEIPVSIADLGILRNVVTSDKGVEVTLAPTYSGCPAMSAIEQEVRTALKNAGVSQVVVKWSMSPPWTTDWITEKGKATLIGLGISAPKGGQGAKAHDGIAELVQIRPRISEEVRCPHCLSTAVMLDSWFGATACKALYHCGDCLEPFEHFKAH